MKQIRDAWASSSDIVRTTLVICVARDAAGNLPYLAAGTYYVKSAKAGYTFTVDTETVS